MTRAWRPWSTALLFALAVLLAPSDVFAQPRPRPTRFEVSAGGLFVGGYSLGSRNADLITNQTGGGPYTLFKSDTNVDGSFGFDARAGVRLSRMFTVEGGLLASQPRMTTRLTSDVESAPQTTAREDLSLYIIDGAVAAQFGSNPRIRPFVRAGAGYVRELHADNSMVETGTAFHVGGGVTMWFGAGRRRFGARADARVYIVQDGISFGDGNRTLGAGGAAVVFAF